MAGNAGSTRELLTTSSVAPGDMAVVSFSGMMNGALAVDATGTPLRSAIIWADQRATAEAEFLAHCCGVEQVYRRTGHRAGGGSCTAAEMLWIQRHQPELYACPHQFLQAKDYAAYKLSGVFATDYSDASSTNLFNLERRDWAVDMIQAVGLDPRKLPPVHPSNTVIGQATSEAAAEIGLLSGTPVVIAGGVGVGLFPDFRVAHEIVQVEEGERPNAAAQARYAELYPLFQETYRALEPIYEQLGKKQGA